MVYLFQIATPCYFLLDVLFTHFIIGTLSIQVWRGLWNVIDNILLPDDKLKSYYICLGFGAGASLLLLSLEELICRLSTWSKRHHWLLALAMEDIMKFVAVIVGLVLWRGSWGMMKDYVIAGPCDTVDCWIYHGAGMTGTWSRWWCSDYCKFIHISNALYLHTYSCIYCPLNSK